ncbi:MAG: hypothetical protein FWH24_02540 [Oscillospiraceae bacterium]|nr:hypothetical protein [Oscillospiraceae bacterium]
MIEIITLGNFTIKVNDENVSDIVGRSKKLWQLLNVFILNKNKPLSVQMIADHIWSEEDIESANKGIHNLIYRMNRMFGAGIGAGKFVVFKNNGYMLNLNENVSVDIYTVEDNYEKTKIFSLPENEKIGYFEKITELYNGEYLSGKFDDNWTMTAAGRYSRIFVNSVIALSELYMERGEYENLFRICDKALALEPFEEAIYICTIKGLMQTDQNVRAISLCEKYFERLSNEIGIHATEPMRELYAELKRSSDFTPEKQELAHGFEVEEHTNKLFLCNIKTFNEIYKYELRQLERRRKKDVILSIVSINKKDGGIPSKNTMHEVKKQVRESCFSVLRKGDVLSEYSGSQYIILLTNIKHGDHKIIAERIKNHFYENCRIKDIFINFQIRSLSALDLEIENLDDTDDDILEI